MKILLLLFSVSCNNDNAKVETATQHSTVEDSTKNEPIVAKEKPSARPVHWGYHKEEGPDNWASLTPAYAVCGNGQAQSPVAITTINAKGSTAWKLDYKNSSLRIIHTEQMDNLIDNGHTIQVNVDEGSTLTFENKIYMLKQFHFHTPSEHTLDEKHAPMEMHFVHQAQDGSLAVMAVLFKEGKVTNENLAKIIAHLPNIKGEAKHVKDVNLQLNMHLPEENHAYHYIGSLTTPPCNEGVQWLVLKDPVQLTRNQVEAFSSRIGKNNRPIQPLHDRKIEATELAGQVN
ncbi:MAG TPA: carbonic anhydrase family protein [Chitinophagaceae bacterium]